MKPCHRFHMNAVFTSDIHTLVRWKGNRRKSIKIMKMNIMVPNLFRKYMRKQKIWHWCASDSGTPVNKHVHKSVFERQTATSFLTTGV